jgi:NDP-sugar pyrophosphorylase family protein
VRNLVAQGIVDLYLAVGYRAELIQAYFQDGKQFGASIHYSREPERLGTAGPLRLIRDDFAITGPVLVMNADIITEVDFQALHRWHVERHPAITVGVRRHDHVVQFGVVSLQGDRICSIEERPTVSLPISCGIYVVESAVLDLVPTTGVFDMPDLIRAVLAQGSDVLGYTIRERWVAVESMEDLQMETARSAGAPGGAIHDARETSRGPT